MASRNVTDVSHAIAAVGSRSLSKAEAFLAKHSPNGAAAQQDGLIDFKPRPYGSYREVVEDENVTIVYVGTPNTSHYDDAKLALDAGKHCLLEKPACLNAAEWETLAALAKEKQRYGHDSTPSCSTYRQLSTRKASSGMCAASTVITARMLSIFDPIPTAYSIPSWLADVYWTLDRILLFGQVDSDSRSRRLTLLASADLDAPLPTPQQREDPASESWKHNDAGQNRSGHRHLVHVELPRDQRDSLLYETLSTAPIRADSRGRHDQSTLVYAKGVEHPDCRIQGVRFGIQLPGAALMLPRSEILVRGHTSRPQSYVVRLWDDPKARTFLPDKVVDMAFEGFGLYWEADEVARNLRDGLLESPSLPHDETLLTMEIFDKIRKEGGYEYLPGLERVK
ncbi:hypothetical protein P7C73_g5098, partial [Tremellales sp. Uapishka_1]